MDIGFIGLGIMGRGMARNLSLKGHDVTGWNRTRHRDLQKKLSRVKMAASIAKAVSGREVIMISVTGPDAQEQVFGGAKGIFAHASKGALIIDLTTTELGHTQELAREARSRKLDYIDAPVFGSKDESWNGKLDIVWGGSAKLGQRAAPAFEAISKSIHHMGAVGSGTTMKLIGNNIVAAEFMALAEGLALARKAGIKLDAIPTLLEAVDYGSGLLTNNARNAIKGDYKPFFYLKHMLKDVRLVQSLARDMEVPSYLAAVSAQSFQGALNEGFGEENVSALVKYVARLSGLKD